MVEEEKFQIVSYSEFLGCKTSNAWIQEALQHPDTLLIDHANCEKKAANTALHLMFRYIEHRTIQLKLSRLAREELRHFEQVLQIMGKRNIPYRYVSASEYAKRLMVGVRANEPGRLIDKLIIGAFIEARSCERFHVIAPFLDNELCSFYQHLAQSESRHFMEYITMAHSVNNGVESIDNRVQVFKALEQNAINTQDQEFRLHSGSTAFIPDQNTYGNK